MFIGKGNGFDQFQFKTFFLFSAVESTCSAIDEISQSTQVVVVASQTLEAYLFISGLG